MKYFWFFILAAFFSIPYCYSQSDRQVRSYIYEKELDKAQTYLEGLLKNTPADVASIVGLGDIYLSRNSADPAEKLFRKALTIDTKNPFALAGLGKVALLKNDHILKNEYFDRARRMGKTDPALYGYIAEGCLSLTKTDTIAADRFLKQGLAINPREPWLHYLTGILEDTKKNYGLAINAYDRALFFDPNSYMAYRNRGFSEFMTGAYKDAELAFNKSIKIKPDQVLAYKYLGDLYYKTGKYSEAEKAYQTYLQKGTVSADDKERFAFILFFNKKYREADSLLVQITKNGENESVLLRVRGYIAYETGNYPTGLTLMEKFFQIHNPTKLIPTDYSYYAQILLKLGKDLPALEQYKKALVLDPSRTELYELVAKLASKNKLHGEAATIYGDMAEHSSEKVLCYFQMGKEYFYEGDNKKSEYDSLMWLNKSGKTLFRDSTKLKKAYLASFTKADSAFTLVTQLSKDYAGGFLWKGRIHSLLDPEAENQNAKHAYENALLILERSSDEKNRRSVIECYKYLGSYYYLGFERLSKTDKVRAAELRSKSYACFMKIRDLDPLDKQANEVIKKMKQ
jgi:tetratricopeptide (TPR) repeat protein